MLSAGGGALVVYADVLVGVNVIITYFLIISTRLICRLPTNKWLVGAASLVGGLSSMIIFYEDMPLVLSVGYKLLVAAIITAVGFTPHSVRGFVKALLWFFGVSFLFGGIMYALEITFNPQNIMYINGTVYFDMSITYLVGSVLLIYGAFLVVNFLLTRYSVKNKIYDVQVAFRDAQVTLRGFCDTGNNLSYGISQRPVIIAELSAVAPLFTYEELKILKSGEYDNIPQSLMGKIHLVPCQTVGGDGFLPAVLPQAVTVKSGNKKSQSPRVCLALSNQRLSGGEYNLILHKTIFNGEWKEINEKVKYSGINK